MYYYLCTLVGAKMYEIIKYFLSLTPEGGVGRKFFCLIFLAPSIECLNIVHYLLVLKVKTTTHEFVYYSLYPNDFLPPKSYVKKFIYI